MASLNYDVIFGGFFKKARAYDIAALNATDANAFLSGWLRSACSKPYIRRFYSTLSLDDEVQKLTFALSYPMDAATDEDFTVELLAIAMVAEWVEPQLNSTLNIQQVYGSGEEKYYSQAAHLETLRGLSQSLKNEQRRLIADRAIFHNSYLNGGA